jgi:hypothetical protein
MSRGLKNRRFYMISIPTTHGGKILLSDLYGNRWRIEIYNHERILVDDKTYASKSSALQHAKKYCAKYHTMMGGLKEKTEWY